MGKEYWTLSFSLELRLGWNYQMMVQPTKRDTCAIKHGTVVLQVLYMINLK